MTSDLLKAAASTELCMICYVVLVSCVETWCTQLNAAAPNMNCQPVNMNEYDCQYANKTAKWQYENWQVVFNPQDCKQE